MKPKNQPLTQFYCYTLKHFEPKNPALLWLQDEELMVERVPKKHVDYMTGTKDFMKFCCGRASRKEKQVGRSEQVSIRRPME